MVSSDPLISSICLGERQKNKIKEKTPAGRCNESFKCPPLPNYKKVRSAKGKEDSDSADDSIDYLGIKLDAEEDQNYL